MTTFLNFGGLHLPLSTVTSTLAFLAIRGAGKTYGAKGLAEEMLEHEQQIVAIDPVGAWGGLRLAADGKKRAYNIPVLGGGQGDCILPEDSGATIAEWLIDTNSPAVLDVSGMSKGRRIRFIGEFAETLYRLKLRPKNRSPLHIFMEEVDDFAPQKPGWGRDGNWSPERTLGAIEDLVRRGRAGGIGISMITQRSAVVNKDILTQTQILVALRTISPQDQGAVESWVKNHDFEGKRQEMMSSLASLAVGEAWVWSPGEFFQRVRFNKLRTYDSSDTPTAATKSKDHTLPEFAGESLDRLQEMLKPKPPPGKPLPAAREVVKHVEVIKEVPVSIKPEIETLEKLQIQMVNLFNGFTSDVSVLLGKYNVALDAAQKKAPPPTAPRSAAKSIDSVAQRTERVPPKDKAAGSIPAGVATDLNDAQVKFLTALASWETLGVRAPKRDLVAIFAGYSPGSGSVNTHLGSLATLGLIEAARGTIQFTDAGRQAVPDWPTQIPTLDALHDAWRSKIDDAKLKFLNIVIDIYPADISRNDLATQAGYSPGSGSVNTHIGALASLGIIEASRGRVVATELLFPRDLQ